MALLCRSTTQYILQFFLLAIAIPTICLESIFRTSKTFCTPLQGQGWMGKFLILPGISVKKFVSYVLVNEFLSFVKC